MSGVKKKIFLITPSFTSGGAERVISQLCINFSSNEKLEVFLLCLVKIDRFYKLPQNVKLIEPSFDHRKFNRLSFTFKTFSFLRRHLKKQRPDTVLSFGGKYNAFVLLAGLGLGLKIFVSDRSRPGISYGKLQDVLNPIMYKRAAGIIAQTDAAKSFLQKKIKHQNIAVIGNPIRDIDTTDWKRQNIILNVGRFIKSKNQGKLLEYFSQVNDGNWKLFFLGDGQYLEATKAIAKSLGIENSIEFIGVVSNIEDYYKKAKIFAFTSLSEGFPNALAEAMSASIACISYDCNAGPSDLIVDGESGFLTAVMDDEDYKRKLMLLMKDEELRNNLALRGKLFIQKFSDIKISQAYLNFILPEFCETIN